MATLGKPRGRRQTYSGKGSAALPEKRRIVNGKQTGGAEEFPVEDVPAMSMSGAKLPGL
jgi:hypothetical protein